MKKLSAFLIAIILFSACQKEQSLPSPSQNELKAVSASNYNKVRNAVLNRAEFETYCSTDYIYTTSVFINGVEWFYSVSGFEYLMYKGLTHVADANNNYFFSGLEYPSDGYVYGIGFGTKVLGTGYYPFTADVKICIPDKNYSNTYIAAPCFAIGDQDFANTDSIRFVVHKRQRQDLVMIPDSIISFAQLKSKLGLEIHTPDSLELYSSLGKEATYRSANIYNWDYYNGGTTDIYGLENAGNLTYNLNFGDALAGSCSGIIDIYLHQQDKIVCKCTTSYSIFYTDYIGSRKQLHIYQ